MQEVEHSFMTVQGFLRRHCLALSDLLADDGRDFGAQQFDGVQQLIMRHGADAQLQQQAVMVEDAVLEQNLLNEVIR